MLKQKINVASRANKLVPNQIIFNQIQFSGKLNYISNDSIKNKIQSYYNNVSNVLDFQEVNANIIYSIGVDMSAILDYNSSIQIVLPDFAKIEVDAFDNSFFYEDVQSDKVKEFISKTTVKQALMLSLYRIQGELLQEGIALKISLIQYLKEQ